VGGASVPFAPSSSVLVDPGEKDPGLGKVGRERRVLQIVQEPRELNALAEELARLQSKSDVAKTIAGTA
jgi:hypothetical protein